MNCWLYDMGMGQVTYPIGSMYAIYGNIYHQYTPNVSIYTSTMDPMGMRWPARNGEYSQIVPSNPQQPPAVPDHGRSEANTTGAPTSGTDGQWSLEKNDPLGSPGVMGQSDDITTIYCHAYIYICTYLIIYVHIYIYI